MTKSGQTRVLTILVAEADESNSFSRPTTTTEHRNFEKNQELTVRSPLMPTPTA